MEKREEWNEFTMNDDSIALLPNYYDYETPAIKEINLFSAHKKLTGYKPASSLYMGQVYYPWSSLESIPESIDSKDLDDELWAIISPPGQYDLADAKESQKYAAEVDDLYENTPYALFMDLGNPGFFEVGMYMRGMENWFMDLLLDEPGVHRLLDIHLERMIDKVKASVAAVGNKIQVLRLSHDDMGNQKSLAASPEVFRKFVFPRYKKLIEEVRKVTDAKIMLHSCGAISEIIPDIIDAGIDILNPLQMNCANMDLEFVKKEYGKDLVLWGGGCDAVDILTNNSVDEIKEHVKHMLDILMKDGGFVFCNTHNIQADIDPEKVVAIYETVREFGKY